MRNGVGRSSSRNVPSWARIFNDRIGNEFTSGFRSFVMLFFEKDITELDYTELIHASI